MVFDGAGCLKWFSGGWEQRVVSVGQGRRSGRRGDMMATVQGLGSPGWEEQGMERWKERRRKRGEIMDKNGKKVKGIRGGRAEIQGNGDEGSKG